MRIQHRHSLGLAICGLVLVPIFHSAVGADVGADSGGTTLQRPIYDVAGEDNSELGASTAVSGNTLVAGAPGSGKFGEVMVFQKTRTGWHDTATIVGSSTSFGSAVALSGSTLLVGAPSADTDEGRAFVFSEKEGRWSHRATLEPLDKQQNEDFGASVALSGTTALIGAPMSTNSQGAGRAYLFSSRGSEWVQINELKSMQNRPGELFGFSVGLNATTAVVGSPGPSGPVSSSRPEGELGVYVYTRAKGHWKMVAQLRDPSDVRDQQFGVAVAIRDGVIAAGSPGQVSAEHHIEPGATYLFSKGTNGWQRVAEITGAEAELDAGMPGSSVVLGAGILVTSPDDVVITAGLPVLVYKVTASRWHLSTQLADPDRTTDNAFGDSVALIGNTVIVGDPSRSGRIYFYRI